VTSYCPSCSHVSECSGLVLVRSSWRVWHEHCRWCRHFRAGSAAAGRGAPGCGVEVPGCGDAVAAGGPDRVVPGDAEPVSRAAPRVELPGLDPVVDDTGTAAKPAGGLGDADLAVRIRRWGGDVVGVADPLHGLGVERAAVAGDHPSGVELPG